MSSIVHIYKRFPTPESCITHLESVRWADNPYCPYCHSPRVGRKNDGGQRWNCHLCHKSFSVTVGTIFHNSHTDLKKWFVAIYKSYGDISTSRLAREMDLRRGTLDKILKLIRENKGKWEVMGVLDALKKWKPIVGYEGIYEVSDFGDVKNIERNLILSPQQNERGYWHVGLYKNGKGTRKYVQRIVLEAFVGACPENMEACHRDGEKSNNALQNLRWDTSEKNHADRIIHGTDGRGERGPTAKLTEKSVLEIRGMTESLSRIGKKYGVSKHTIADIKAGRTWTHI